MAKTKKLSDLGKFYIDNNPNVDDVELAKKTGVSVQTVQEYKSTSVTFKKNKVDEDKKIADQEEESRAERLERVANSGLTAGKVMARGNGVVAMTEAASEVSDAKKIARGPTMSREQFAKNNRTRIHKIDPRKPVR